MVISKKKAIIIMPRKLSLIQENVPLNDKNWFETGGSARYFAQPTQMHKNFNDRLPSRMTNQSSNFLY